MTRPKINVPGAVSAEIQTELVLYLLGSLIDLVLRQAQHEVDLIRVRKLHPELVEG
jgi:hypothetical protein